MAETVHFESEQTKTTLESVGNIGAIARAGAEMWLAAREAQELPKTLHLLDVSID